MGYVVQRGDTIWDIAERTLIMETKNPQPPVPDVARRMQEIISTNLKKLKGGTPGAADLIFSGMELDIPGFGAPTPGQAISNGKKSAPGGGPDRAKEDFGKSKGTPGGGPGRAEEDFGSESGPNRDVWPRQQGPVSAPTGGREPGWGGRGIPGGGPARAAADFGMGGRRPASAPTGGREPGWGGRGTPGGGPNRAAEDFGTGFRSRSNMDVWPRQSTRGQSQPYEPYQGQSRPGAGRAMAYEPYQGQGRPRASSRGERGGAWGELQRYSNR